MRNDVSETYSTHPCSRGYATCVAATRVHTQNPNTCNGKAQKASLAVCRRDGSLCRASLVKSSAEGQKVGNGADHQL